MRRRLEFLFIVLALNIFIIKEAKFFQVVSQRTITKTPNESRVKKSLQWNVYNSKCLSNEDGDQSDCPPKRCSKNHHCWEEYGHSKLCVCDPHLCGLVCLQYDLECPRPKQPLDGEARYIRLRVGDHVEYTCKFGYVIKGPKKRYCQANLQLTERDPVCTNQTDSCFPAPNIPNTQVSDDIVKEIYRNKETFNVTCQKGFEDPNKTHSISTCIKNEWKIDPINCRRISCGKLIDPENGRTMYQHNYTYQSVAIQFCDDGYKIKCSPIVDGLEKNCKRVCLANKTWSGGTTCNRIFCPELKPPENGIILGNHSTVNSLKIVKCREGYKLSGSYLFRCLHTGNWYGSTATCNAACHKPSTPVNGKMQFHNENGDKIHLTNELMKLDHNTEVKYVCLPKYKFSGPKSAICLNGRWSPPEAPRCDFIKPNELALALYYALTEWI